MGRAIPAAGWVAWRAPACMLYCCCSRRIPAERARRVEEHRSLLGSSPGVGVLSELDVDLPATWREHFGYQDGIAQVCVEGTGVEPPPGSGAAAKPGEFVLGLSRRDVLRPHPSPPRVAHSQRQLPRLPAALPGCRRLPGIPAAKRSHARRARIARRQVDGPLAQRCPPGAGQRHDDPDLVADPQRSNNFNYGQMDPRGTACPIGAHIRRVNPRDTITNRRRRWRRAALRLAAARRESR